jgi:rSAM/selenodomain-associated transferase 1
VPGHVKTRLQPVVSAEAVAELHACFVDDVLSKLDGFRNLAEVELHTDVLTEAWRNFPYQRALQREGDLGEKMLGAIEGAFAAGRPQVLLIGTDSPDLPVEYLQELLESRADVTLGPTEDGGYYAIHCRRAHRLMFQGVEWSTSSVLEQTRAATEAMGLTVELGKDWYDVDGPADLVRLVTSRTPPRTTEWLKKHGFLMG